jgi:hypothetical protein
LEIQPDQSKAIGTGNLHKIAHLMTRHLLHFKNQFKVCE